VMTVRRMLLLLRWLLRLLWAFMGSVWHDISSLSH
jgi:hypothetical protein